MQRIASNCYSSKMSIPESSEWNAIVEQLNHYPITIIAASYSSILLVVYVLLCSSSSPIPPRPLSSMCRRSDREINLKSWWWAFCSRIMQRTNTKTLRMQKDIVTECGNGAWFHAAWREKEIYTNRSVWWSAHTFYARFFCSILLQPSKRNGIMYIL